jgi:hypothetical protein
LAIRKSAQTGACFYFLSQHPISLPVTHVLKTGWTPERAAPFYGGISEIKMRSMVAYARRQGFLK